MATLQTLIDEVQYLGGLSSAEEATARRWAKGGLHMVEQAGRWPWLMDYATLTLTENQYAYNLIATSGNPVSTAGGRDGTGVFGLNTKTFRYAQTKLQWSPFGPQPIEKQLGRDWKENASKRGTPRFVCRVGRQLWFARVPDSDFVAANPSIYFYCWVTEDVSDDDNPLLLPDPLIPNAAYASFAYGMWQDDNPAKTEAMAEWQRVWLPGLHTMTREYGEADIAFRPEWAREDGDSGMQDGYESW